MTSSTRSSSIVRSRRKLGTSTSSSLAAALRRQAEARRGCGGRLRRRRDAEHALHARHAQAHARRGVRRRIRVDHAARDPSAGELWISCAARALAVDQRVDVGAALEPVRGVGLQPERARRPPDRRRQEVRGSRAARAWCASVTSVSAPPITPAIPMPRCRIGDQQHRRDRARASGRRASSCARPARARRTTIGAASRLPDGVVVERVQRMADLPHHVVRDVDHVADRAAARPRAAAPPSTPATGPTRTSLMTRAVKRWQRSGSSIRTRASASHVRVASRRARSPAPERRAGQRRPARARSPTTDRQSGRFGVISISSTTSSSPRWLDEVGAERRVGVEQQHARPRAPRRARARARSTACPRDSRRGSSPRRSRAARAARRRAARRRLAPRRAAFGAPQTTRIAALPVLTRHSTSRWPWLSPTSRSIASISPTTTPRTSGASG